MTQIKKTMNVPGEWPGWENFVDRLFPYMPPLVDPVLPPGTPLDFTPLSVPSRGGAEGDDGNKGGASGPAASSRGLETPSSDAGGFESPGYRTGPGLGSNNWAVSGKLTRNGFPLLSNDMHLELSLPAVWYEIQLSAPGVNVRGVAFPAAPLVIAGYNKDVAWGFTNGTDDVLDWYDITFKDDSRAEYLYGGEWRKTSVREEKIKVRGGTTVVDKVVYTHYGPVVRLKDEPPFTNMNVPPDAALRWLAHDASSEFSTLYALNRARNYEDYVQALKTWDCPAQNIVFADREGTIAIWHDGKYPLRWKGQGRYVLDGSDPADEWRGWVPRGHVPHVKDPDRGFVSSANQMPADAGYPYYLGWDYAPYERGARINEILRSAHDITPADMVRMQADVLDIRVRAVLPSLLDIIKEKPATEAEKKSFEELRAWNFEARAALIAPTIFREFWNGLNRLTWDDEKPAKMERMPRPASQVTVDQILNDPHGGFFDLPGLPDRDPLDETLDDIAKLAFRSAIANLEKRLGPFGETWRWGKVKGTQLRHIARIPGFGREKLEADGVGHVIDAIDAVRAFVKKSPK